LSGSAWLTNIPTEGTTLRVDNQINSLYSYLDIGTLSWVKQDFETGPFFPRFDVPSGQTISIATGSQYLIYGDLDINGGLDTWGKVTVINGSVSGTASLGIYGSGSLTQIELLTNIYAGVGITISATTYSTRTISSDIQIGSGLTSSLVGNSLLISAISGTSVGRPKYLISSGETISVADYEEYYIYGDLEVRGLLDIATYGKVVVTNGNLISASGSTINNIGNVEIYDLLTVADDNLKIDISEVKYGKAGRILFESELKYVPIQGTFTRVVTESDDLVYSTSSAYSTSTVSTSFDYYLGISTLDPQKKLHIRNSGLLIDGSESEQTLGLSNSNWARLVIDSNTGNVQDLLDLRNNQGRVLFAGGAIDGGVRYPSVSIGSTGSLSSILRVSDYSGNDYFKVSRLGQISLGTVSSSTASNYLVWDSTTGNLGHRESSKPKSGYVPGLSFSGSVPGTISCTVSFVESYGTSSYSVVLTSELPSSGNRIYYIDSKSDSEFAIKLVASATFSEGVYWQSMLFGEY